MSLNIISETEIKTLSKTLLDLIKEEEKVQLKDMKMYLNKTNASTELKLKEYSAFSTSLFNAKVTACLQTAQQYIMEDARLVQQKAVNTAQIDLTKAQKLVAVQEELMAKEKILLTKEEIKQTQNQIDFEKIKMWVFGAEAQVKLTNTVANTMTEARKNGASITKDIKSFTLPTTGQTISYAHLSLAAASATDTTQGLLGIQMLQLKNQADTFKDHTKVQVANQIMQLGSTAISDGLTSIGGILTSHKQLCTDLVGQNIFTSDYTTIG